MPKKRTIKLRVKEKRELKDVRKKHPKAYMRERAAAILKISEGKSPHYVATQGLLMKRDPDTVYAWLDRYESDGLAGLQIKKGRGRKPAFFPRYDNEAEAQTSLLHLIRRDPIQLGYSRSRWSLDMIAESCDWLQETTASGVHQILKRLKISYKWGRDYIHSPDRFYEEKLSLIELARLRAYYDPDHYVLLYLDALTYYRQPNLSQAYEQSGPVQPLAHRSHKSNSTFRVLGALNAITGQVNYLQRFRTTLACLSQFWFDLRTAYPQAKLIYIALDNWPVHFHPDVLAPLQPQAFPFPPKLPPTWPTTPSKKAHCDQLPIQLLSLPTYASWLNPIEKLWRWLNQDILHLHRLSSDWQALKQLVAKFLDQFKYGSTELLSYVGLLPN